LKEYWNHNTAFHAEIVFDTKKRHGRVLDIGCGDGLLLQRLAPVAKQVVGIDPDENAIRLAQTRLATMSNVSLIHNDFLAMPVPGPEERYSTITCVAALHHMELEAALVKMRQLLAPGGRLLIIGLAADKSIMDTAISGLSMFPIRIMDRFHGGVQDVGVKIADPRESLSEIRGVVKRVLPGAIVKRRFYYRYFISWDQELEPIFT
jgi:ubiquinone/menaquinone biosynthesis C-methylase UbiE